jgi:hypothetical protein
VCVNHGAFDEIIRILYGSRCRTLKFMFLVPNQTGDGYVIIDCIINLYKRVVHSCLRGVFLYMRGNIQTFI